MTESSELHFAEAEFCPDCGTVLDMSRIMNLSHGIECEACEKQMDLRRFVGIVSTSRIVFNSREEAKKAADALKNKDKKKDAPDECVVDKECPFCGHGKLTYATLQTRSADEGQTVFYTCLKCGGKHTENS